MVEQILGKIQLLKAHPEGRNHMLRLAGLGMMFGNPTPEQAKLNARAQDVREALRRAGVPFAIDTDPAYPGSTFVHITADGLDAWFGGAR